MSSTEYNTTHTNYHFTQLYESSKICLPVISDPSIDFRKPTQFNIKFLSLKSNTPVFYQYPNCLSISAPKTTMINSLFIQIRKYTFSILNIIVTMLKIKTQLNTTILGDEQWIDNNYFFCQINDFIENLFDLSLRLIYKSFVIFKSKLSRT